ncbi:MAG: hypothetical protein U5Q03_16490 [Bacteroidota bacterium]|nr:hypothetical protein [Bacteroidota bacterium]
MQETEFYEKNKFPSSFSFAVSYIHAQDTLNMIHYNLLHYNNFTSYCTTYNNPLDEKNESLRVILNFNRPDIFTVNELQCSATSADILLEEVLNNQDIASYARAAMSCNGYLSNMIYYNTQKLGLAGQDAVQTNVRVIDIYKLYHKPSGTDLIIDTVFLHVIVAHLKSGNSGPDAAERADEVQKLLDHMEVNYQSGNFLFAGDYNVYSSSEEAFKKLIDPGSAFRFYDPADMIGNWHNNAFFAPVHTQSTHTSGGCPSGGGMDDRFDFILATADILQGTKDVKYLAGSYHAIGQDGEHFNKSLLDPPTIPGIPLEVVEALYTASDHLPVNLQLIVEEETGWEEQAVTRYNYILINPVREQAELLISVDISQQAEFAVFDLTGRKLLNKKLSLEKGSNRSRISLGTLPQGAYIFHCRLEDGSGFSGKMIR